MFKKTWIISISRPFYVYIHIHIHIHTHIYIYIIHSYSIISHDITIFPANPLPSAAAVSLTPDGAWALARSTSMAIRRGRAAPQQQGGDQLWDLPGWNILEGCMLGVIIPGTSLDWKKNDLFLKNLVLGKQIGKKQSRGLPRGLPGTK